MVRRSARANPPEGNQQADRDIELNKLRQHVQQLQERLACMEATRNNHDDSYRDLDGETYGEVEFNPFHDNHTLVSSDEEALHQNHTRRN
jgi:ABC-type phosphate transport system auxiliary subunit